MSNSLNLLEVPGGAIENNKTFFNHILNLSPEGKAEFINVLQYGMLGLLPVLLLNKLIHNYIPEANEEKSNLELLVEIMLQLIVMFCGIILIHRGITYVPTYSGYLYESMNLTSVILAFLIIILSLQTKIGIKVNIVYDRVIDLWNGTSGMDEKKKKENMSNSSRMSQHRPSQADSLADNQGIGLFPPQPVVTSKETTNYDHMLGGSTGNSQEPMMNDGPMAANSLVGGSFGSAF
jgi:hypothetical protein